MVLDDLALFFLVFLKNSFSHFKRFIFTMSDDEDYMSSTFMEKMNDVKPGSKI